MSEPLDPTVVDWELLERFAAGVCSEAEAARVQTHFAAQPGDERFFRTLAQELSGANSAALATVDAHASLRALHQRLDQPATEHVRHRPHAGRLFTGVAAALVAVAVGVVWHRMGSVASMLSVGAGHEYVTPAARRETVTLVDGTQFTLAPASRLRVQANYGRAIRQVDLEGEAYFTVVHDAAHPFVVHARNAIATDLGTRFDVRAYATDTAVRVVVAEGGIALTAIPSNGVHSERAHSVALSAGQAAQVDTHDRIGAPEAADVATLTSWTSGTLTFDGTLLPDVVAELSRWYGVEVRLTDPGDARLARRHVAATFAPSPLASVLAALAPTVGARVERAGAAYVLVPLPQPGTP